MIHFHHFAIPLYPNDFCRVVNHVSQMFTLQCLCCVCSVRLFSNARVFVFILFAGALAFHCSLLAVFSSVSVKNQSVSTFSIYIVSDRKFSCEHLGRRRSVQCSSRSFRFMSNAKIKLVWFCAALNSCFCQVCRCSAK